MVADCKLVILKIFIPVKLRVFVIDFRSTFRLANFGASISRNMFDCKHRILDHVQRHGSEAS